MEQARLTARSWWGPTVQHPLTHSRGAGLKGISCTHPATSTALAELQLPAVAQRAAHAALCAKAINEVLREVLEELVDEASESPVQRVIPADAAGERPTCRIRSVFDLGESRAAKRAQEAAIAALQLDLFGTAPELEPPREAPAAPAAPAPHTAPWVTAGGAIFWGGSPFDVLRGSYRRAELPGDKERERRARQKVPPPPKQTFTLGRRRSAQQPRREEFEDMEEFE